MRFVALLALIVSLAIPASAQQLQVNPSTGESEAQFAARTKWWRDAKFGMFIHWGIYSVPADSTDLNGNKGAAEWYFSNKHAQVKDYEKFAAQFDPVKFDARRWVATAKAAGMKYIVITTKHHDGFCMFDSKLTNYCITKATPFHRDPMKELAAECKKQGIKLCFYHSIMDWHQPDYLPRRPWEGDNRPADGANLDRYIKTMEGQLTELLTHYGPIGIIWFDGGWEHNAEELHSAEVNAMIRRLQPGIMINDRNHQPEDYSTPEQTIPANALPGGRLWETCMTMNDTWGYAKNDTDWKSSEDLIHKLCDIASKGGNFLLNVGPTSEGVFPDAIDERLADIGRWMDVNGASIYGTTKSPFRRLPFDGRCTAKGNRLYLQVFHWPAGGLQLSGLLTPVVSARALSDKQPLKVVSSTGGATQQIAPESALITAGVPELRIEKPKQLDPVATVIELRLAGPPKAADVTEVIRPGADGAVTLNAADAEIQGSAQVETKDGTPNIGFWTNASDKVSWEIGVPRRAAYAVKLLLACPDDTAGATFHVRIEREMQSLTAPVTLSGTVPATGGWGNFTELAVGDPAVLEPGRWRVTIVPDSMPHGAVMNLRSVVLAPVG